MRYAEMKPGRRYDLLLRYGKGIQEAVEELVEKEGIREGYLSAGLGGFDNFSLRHADGDETLWDGAIVQLSSVEGFIRNGQVEVYASVTRDGADKLTRTGLVEPGTTRMFYGELFVQELLPL